MTMMMIIVMWIIMWKKALDRISDMMVLWIKSVKLCYLIIFCRDCLRITSICIIWLLRLLLRMISRNWDRILNRLRKNGKNGRAANDY